MFADDGAGARERGIVFEGGLEPGELFVFVVGVDSYLVDQRVEAGVGLAGWAYRRVSCCLLGLGGWVQAVKDEWWAADLRHDDALDAVQVAGGWVTVQLVGRLARAEAAPGRCSW